MAYYYIIFAIIILINFILVINFSKIKIFNINIDRPDNKRKIHLKPVPLAGGSIIILNIIFYFFLYNFFNELFKNEIIFNDKNSSNLFFIFTLIIFFLGFFDDKYNLNANLKFLVLTIIIFLFLNLDKNLILDEIKFSFFDNPIQLNKFSLIFSIFSFLVFLNAFNMFDGIDLQASFYSLFIFFFISFFFLNNIFFNILIISLISFSFLNYKNKSFLGDSGTLLLGFIFSYTFIRLYNLEYIEFADDVVMYMLIPGIDLIRLFITRILKKRSPLSSDRQHIHHILIKKYSLKKTLLIILMLILCPIILSNLNINNLLVILITLLSYSLILINSTKKN